MSCSNAAQSAAMAASAADKYSSTVVLSTSIVALVSGFLLGVYSIRGYLVSPALAEERRRNFRDPVESDESDIDEDDTILDHAPNWSNGADADRRDGLRVAAAATSAKKGKKKSPTAAGDSDDKTPVIEVNTGSDEREECKLVLVVRTDLGMTKGKIAAQCSHATLACYKVLSRAAAKSDAAARLLRRWEHLGQAKIAVQIKSQEELMELQGVAHSLGVTAEAIHDAGRTQIAAGSMTVLGVGPAPKSLVDQITGKLKLL